MTVGHRVVGQGGPPISPCGLENLRGVCGFRRRRWFWALCALCAHLVFSPLVESQAQSPDSKINIRLRVEWGGGELPKRWSGSMTINPGHLSNPRGLGLETDKPGSIHSEQGQILIRQRSLTTFDSFDVEVVATKNAILEFRLSAVGDLGQARVIRVPIAKLISPNTFHGAALDDGKSRLLVRRSPGDRLRIEFSRQSLVFEPQENFVFFIRPNNMGLAADEDYECIVQLLRGRTDEELWSETRSLTTASDGSAAIIGPVELAIPKNEGVYDVLISLYSKEFGRVFRKGTPALRRLMQCVVVDQSLPTLAAAPWNTHLTIDPANPRWWEPFTRIPDWNWIVRFGKEQLGNGRLQKREIGTRTFVELAAGGWQAYPLPVSNVGKPHILEIEYPTNNPQTLAISIVEPNAAGQVVPFGLDSGISVANITAMRDSSSEHHRLLFWPKTATPWVVVSNQSISKKNVSGKALYGRLRVFEGPSHLPPADELVAPTTSTRLISAYFEKPLFPENFGARDALDERSNRSLDDWITFFEGGQRLAEYLKYVGFNAAVVTVACDGSAIYPSPEVLQPTPKHDTGVFFSTGQDPIRKDVLELLFRIFDREGLVLIPSIQFSSPLPQLERLVRAGEDAHGIELISPQQNWSSEALDQESLVGPRYNALDPRVQAEMQRVLGELIKRYSHHRAFGGIAIQMGADSYTQVPDATWGMDQRTISRFEADFKLDTGLQTSGNKNTRNKFVEGPDGVKWLDWRSEKLGAFYEDIAERLTAVVPEARLFLLTADLLKSRPLEVALQPRLPERSDVEKAMLRMGIDGGRLRNTKNVVLINPRRLKPPGGLIQEKVDLIAATSKDLRSFFQSESGTVGMTLHEALTFRLPQFESQSPFGSDNTRTWFLAHVSPAGFHNRARFVRSLADGDQLHLMDGGWMLPLGQEAALRPLFATFRQLPNRTFEDVNPFQSVGHHQPVMVRTLRQDGVTYIYILNDAPWPVTATLNVSAQANTTVHVLGNRSLPSLVFTESGVAPWQFALEPYDFVAAQIQGPEFRVNDWDTAVPPAVFEQLRYRISEIRLKAKTASHVQPITNFANSSFEEVHAQRPIPGWIHSQLQARPKSAVQIQSAYGVDGNQCLVVKNGDEEPLWVRSEVFQKPVRGRIEIHAWLRTPDDQHQPSFRLGVEGRIDGKSYYRYAKLGGSLSTSKQTEFDSQPNPAIKEQWLEYRFPIYDLPLVGLEDLRIALDVMSRGEVWIDEVRVFDVLFTRNEDHELLKNIASADVNLDEGKVGDTERFLNSYWPRFLDEFIPSSNPRVARQPQITFPAEGKPQGTAPPTENPQEENRFGKLLKYFSPF